MQNYTQHTGGRRIARQGEKITGKEHLMTQNSSGAFTFQLDDWARLERFLILGSDRSTYYASAHQLTLENLAVVERLLAVDGPRVVKTIRDVSHGGRAPHNDPALFALALCLLPNKANLETRQAALVALPDVARTGTDLYHFIKFSEDLGRGWGRMLKRAVSSWYGRLSVDDAAFQLMKYKQRDGWSARDLFRLAHPNPGADPARRALYHWVVKPEELGDALPDRVRAAVDIHAFKDADGKGLDHAVQLISEHRLPREVLPTELLAKKEIWDALVWSMPLTAMVRNLAKMTAVGMLTQTSSQAGHIVDQLENQERIQKSRLHPLAILKALRQYEKGQGERGKLTWTPVRKIVEALDVAFRLSFKNVKPTGKRIGLFLDVSASMMWPQSMISGLSITAREASAAMSLVTAAVEKDYGVWSFSNGIEPLAISPRQTLWEVMERTNRLQATTTDIGLPMQMAIDQKLELDAFIIYTDNETNHSMSGQPSELLKDYRRRSGIDAKLIVVGMVSNGFTVADPTDNGMLDVVGFDTAAPAVISDFITGGQTTLADEVEEE